MSPRGPGAVALTLGFTSLRSHPVPSLRRGCENTLKYFFLASFSRTLVPISPMGAISRMISVHACIIESKNKGTIVALQRYVLS